MKKSNVLRIAIIAVLSWVMATGSAAQEFPTRPILMVVGTAAGSSADAMARLVAGKMSKSLGQPVVVENRVGAGGAIGAAFVAKAPPDGQTILFIFTAALVQRGLNPQNSVDPVNDFAHIGMITKSAGLLLAPTSAPFKSVPELIAYAKTFPGKVDYGSAGIGSGSHYAIEAFSSKAGVKLNHVPYKGTSALMPDLLTGRIQLYYTNAADAVPAIASGKVVPLGIIGTKRISVLPDVPLIADMGINLSFEPWFGLVGPKAMRPGVVDKLNAALNVALSDAEVREWLTARSLDTVQSSPNAFAEYMRKDLADISEVIRQSGMKAE